MCSVRHWYVFSKKEIIVWSIPATDSTYLEDFLKNPDLDYG